MKDITQEFKELYDNTDYINLNKTTLIKIIKYYEEVNNVNLINSLTKKISEEKDPVKIEIDKIYMTSLFLDLKSKKLNKKTFIKN